MRAILPSFSWKLRVTLRFSCAACLCGLFSACVVSFPDYPEGDIATGGSGAGLGGVAAGTAGSNAGKGGSAGSGGANMQAAGDAMIDDFEDGDGNILMRGGRHGSWYVTNDGTGTQSPDKNDVTASMLPDARGSSLWGFHTHGTGFTTWGAAVRVDFNTDSGGAHPYDASAYVGIELWARSGDGKQHNVSFLVPSVDTDDDCDKCGDHFGREANVTGDWQQVQLKFSELVQGGWGDVRSGLDLTRLDGVMLIFPRKIGFDLWIDDVTFY